MSQITHKFGLSKWSAWGIGELSDSHKLSHIFHGAPKSEGIAPMAKRRMPLMAKYIYDLTQTIRKDLSNQNVPTVFVSKNAELSRTFKLIRSFDADVSPMQFSMSVHNAIAGLLSVINKNKGNYTVIDSMSGSLETAIIEAIGLLYDYNTVQIIYFDESLPEELKNSYPLDEKPIALSLLINKGADFTISSQPNKNKDAVSESFEQLIQFLSRKIVRHQSTSKRIMWEWKCHAST